MTSKSSGMFSKYKEKPKKRRRGIHAKSRMSINKSSKHYQKRLIGQGK